MVMWYKNILQRNVAYEKKKHILKEFYAQTKRCVIKVAYESWDINKVYVFRKEDNDLKINSIAVPRYIIMQGDIKM